MAYREGDELVTFEDVMVVDRRPPEKQERSVICKFEDGRERFVARSQVPPWQEFPDDGSVFDLEVTRWMATQWENEAPPPTFALDDVVALRVSRKGAVLVRLSDGKEEWVPGQGIDGSSEVKEDGDRGRLVVAEWVAKSRGWLKEQPRAANVGDDARGGVVGGDDDIPF